MEMYAAYSYTGAHESFTWGLTGEAFENAIVEAINARLDFELVLDRTGLLRGSKPEAWTSEDAFTWGVATPYSVNASRVLANNTPADELWESSHEGNEI